MESRLASKSKLLSSNRNLCLSPHKYVFKTGAKFAVFSYHGCQILITGNLGIQPYTSSETPMIMYLNIHAALEKNRVDAEKSNKGKGPVTMVVGPTDSGKSTLCR